MAQPAITTEVHQSLDVHRDLAAQIAFNGQLVDLIANLLEIAIRQILDLLGECDADRITDFLR